MEPFQYVKDCWYVAGLSHELVCDSLRRLMSVVSGQWSVVSGQ